MSEFTSRIPIKSRELRGMKPLIGSIARVESFGDFFQCSAYLGAYYIGRNNLFHLFLCCKGVCVPNRSPRRLLRGFSGLVTPADSSPGQSMRIASWTFKRKTTHKRWRIRDSNPSVLLIANESATPSSPSPRSSLSSHHSSSRSSRVAPPQGHEN